MNWYIPLAAIAMIAALCFASFKWGVTHQKNEVLSAQNAALFEYVKTQKEVNDKYASILEKLPINANPDAIIDYAINSLPDNSHTDSRLRPSPKAKK